MRPTARPVPAAAGEGVFEAVFAIRLTSTGGRGPGEAIAFAWGVQDVELRTGWRLPWAMGPRLRPEARNARNR